MGWVEFIVTIVRLVSSIWVPKRRGKFAPARTIAHSFFSLKSRDTQEHMESLCPLGESFREKG